LINAKGIIKGTLSEAQDNNNKKLHQIKPLKAQMHQKSAQETLSNGSSQSNSPKTCFKRSHE